MSFTENILPIIYTRKEMQEWEALVATPFPLSVYSFVICIITRSSSMMWYYRLFAIMMCQHLDAWDLPNPSTLKVLFEQAA